MPTIGHHETASRLQLTGAGGVYTLSAEQSRAIKIFEPTEGLLPDEHLRREVDAFLLRAKTQRLISKSAKHWAPIHEISAIKGTTPADDPTPPPYPGAYRAAGAYLISDKYERSLQTLIEAQVYVTNDDLRNLFTQIFTALIEAYKSAKRPHGNLKASNVLLAHSSPLASAAVFLADPAADGSLNPKLPYEKDLTDLGRLIYALVLRRPYDGGTIPPSREWKRLGPNGEDWRDLASDLLDVGEKTTPDDRDLEKLLPKIATWTLQPKKAPVVPIASAAALLLIGGGVGLYFLLRAPTADFKQPDWARLCLSYDSWFSDFLDADSSDAIHKKFTGPDYPAQAFQIIDAAAKAGRLSSPTDLAKSGHSLSDLAVHPTLDAKSGKNAFRTQDNVKIIDAVAAALTPGPAPDHWPLLGSLDTTAKAYKTNGWNKAANAIDAIIAGAKPPTFSKLPAENDPPPDVDKVNEVARIDATVKAAHDVTAIDKSWNDIQGQFAKLPKSNVQLINDFPDFAKSFAQSPDEPGTPADLTALKTSFQKIQDILTPLVDKLNPKDEKIDFDELAKDPATQVPNNDITKLTVANFQSLPDIAQGYYVLKTDPTTKTPYAQQLDKIQTEMIDVIQHANPQDKLLPHVLDEDNTLKKQVTYLASIAKIKKNEVTLNDETKKADDLLAALQHDGEEAVVPYTVKPVDYLAQQNAYRADPKSPLAAATPVVLDDWKTHQQQYLATIADNSKGQEHFKYDDYKRYDNNLKALEKYYLGLDAFIPTSANGLTALPASAPDWQKTIATHVATDYRSAALADIMKNLKFTDGVPTPIDPAYADTRKHTFDNICTDTKNLIDDYATIQTRLDHLDLLPNEPAPGAATWRALSQKWTDAHSPLLADATITAALKPITDRVSALLGLDNQTAYAPLATDATAAPAPELALTAWRKLGDTSVPLKESDPVLTDDDKAQSHLTDQFSTLQKSGNLTPARTTTLTAELTTARPTRWRRYADILTTPDLIQSTLDAAQKFNVTLSPQTDPRMTYNLALYNLRKQYDTKPKEDQLKTDAQQFITSAKAMPVTSDPAFRISLNAMLDHMAKPLKPTAEQESASTKGGPELAGWTMNKPRDGVIVFTIPATASTLAHTLEFDRVEVSEDGDDKQVYIAATETPVRLFADVLNPRLAELDNAKFSTDQKHWLVFPTGAKPDQWSDLGPRSWQIVGSSMAVNPAWLDMSAPPMTGYSFYPNNATPPKPTADSPVQNVSVYTSVFFARLVGCRLPTQAEWTAAYNRYEAGYTEKDAWNLRGAGTGLNWVGEQEQARQMNVHGMFYPEKNTFLLGEPQDDKGTPWTYDMLAKILPRNRLTATSGNYNGSTIWFRDVGHEPGLPTSPGAGVVHDLVGNVAEYLLDYPNASAVIKDINASPVAVDAEVTGDKSTVSVIGGSSLSPPDVDPLKAQPILVRTDAQADNGYADVGIRLAYTAPLETIQEALGTIFKAPPYLPGKNATPAPR